MEKFILLKKYFIVSFILILCLVILNGCFGKTFTDISKEVKNSYVKNMDDNTYTKVTRDKAFNAVMKNVKWGAVKNNSNHGWGSYFVNVTGEYNGHKVLIVYDTLSDGSHLFYSISLDGEEIADYEYWNFMQIAMTKLGYGEATYE
jgi:hypothetical protein